jgi:hypothetical protein
MKSRVENLKDSGWFTTDGGNFHGERKTLPELLKDIIELMKEKGFDQLYVQERGEIKKDDQYIQLILNHPIETIHHGYAYYLRGYKEVYHERLKANVMKDVVKPLYEKNPDIEELVVGWEYKNIWLLDEYDENKKIDLPDDFKLYVFDFTYNLEDIIKKENGYVLLKEAKLDYIDIL